jgi:type IV secretion system protein VirB11
VSTHDIARQLRHMLTPLDPWRLDPATDDIAINRPGEAFIRSRGQWHRHEVSLEYDDLVDIAILAGALNQQNVSAAEPIVGADLPDGERIQAVLPPCVPDGTVSLTIRVHESSVVPLDQATKRYDLTRWNHWDRRQEASQVRRAQLLAAYDRGDIVAFFDEAVRLKFNPILCGHTGAGKTTFLKSLISAISPNERIITIENVLEVDIVNQPNYVRLLYSHGSQGVAKVTQQQLLEAYLRMRPDRGCVGELRDPAAVYTYVSECTTGHPGSPSTIHGSNAPQAATRLFNLFKASDAGRNYGDEMIISQLGMAVDLIVPFREVGGRYEIGEVWLGADAERRGKDFRELLEG